MTRGQGLKEPARTWSRRSKPATCEQQAVVGLLYNGNCCMAPDEAAMLLVAVQSCCERPRV